MVKKDAFQIVSSRPGKASHPPGDNSKAVVTSQ